ncbi:MAG: hypothetical protein ACJ76I_14070 [Gaiellaceae bacterium]
MRSFVAIPIAASGVPFVAAVAGGLVAVVLLLVWLLGARRKRARGPGTTLQHPAASPEAAPAPADGDPAAEPIAAAPAPDPDHLWDVAYERGELGSDGVWRFPHRCRNCGIELLARDVTDATAQADASALPERAP